MRKTYTAALAGFTLSLMLALPAHATPTDPLAGVATGTSLSFKLLGVTTSKDTIGTENTWGAGTITNILNANTASTIWSNGSGAFLNYMIYGVTDLSTTGTPPNINVDSNNVHIDIYLSSTPMDLSGGPNARTGFSSYPTVTNSGNLWLSLLLAPGCDPSNPNATLCQTLLTNTDPASGSGQFAAAIVTGGSAKDEVSVQNGVFDIQAALPGDITAFKPPGACNATGADQSNCFDEVISDPVSATKIPEPSSLSLIGAGLALLGAATWFRRNKSAKAAA